MQIFYRERQLHYADIQLGMKTAIYLFTQSLSKNFFGPYYKQVGLACYSFGRRLAGDRLVEDKLVPSLRALTVKPLQDLAFLAPNSVVIGNVEIGADSSVWYTSVLRGDRGQIRVGRGTIIQDKVVFDPCGRTITIGDKVIISQNSLVFDCTIENNAFVGMGCTLRPGCVVKAGAMVAAGAVVGEGQVVESGEIWAGNPGKLLRGITAAEKQVLREHYHESMALAKMHDEECESSLYKLVQRNQISQPQMEQLQEQEGLSWSTVQEYSKSGVPLFDEDRQFFDTRFAVNYTYEEEDQVWAKTQDPYEQDTTIYSDNYRTRKPNFDQAEFAKSHGKGFPQQQKDYVPPSVNTRQKYA